MNFLNSVSMRNIPRAPDEGAGGGGGGADKGGGGGADKGGGGADKGGGGADKVGADKGGGADKGAGGGGDPWFMKTDYGFDEPTQKFFAGKNYPDEKTALTSLRQADELARARNVITKPDPKNIAGWDGFGELGWIADKAKYVLNKPKVDAAKGEVLDEKTFLKFQDAAHEARLAPWQAEKVFGELHKHVNDGLRDFSAAGATANKELDNALRGKWGDKYDEKAELGKRAFAAFKPDAVSAAQVDQVMGSAAMVELFANIGAAIGEDKLIGDRGGNTGQKTPAAAKAERLRLEGDPEWMKVFKNPRDARNKDFVAQRQNLIELEARR